MKTKTVKTLTDSEKIDVEFMQALDICIANGFETKPIESYNHRRTGVGAIIIKNELLPKEDMEQAAKDAVKILVNKNFDASLLRGNSITLKIGAFKACFTIESVPSLLKEYKSNLSRTVNTFYDTSKGSDSTLKLYKNMRSLTVKPLDMALRFNSADEVKAEIERTESNILAANNDINITPKLAAGKAKPGLLKVFQDELKYWQEVFKIAEETDYIDIAVQKEYDNTPAIQEFTKNWNNSRTRDSHNAYLNERKVFDWFKFYDIKPVNDVDTVLQMYYANELKEGYNNNINQLIQEKQDEADKTRAKTKKMRASGAYYALMAGLKKTEEQIKFLTYNKSEIETLLERHA